MAEQDETLTPYCMRRSDVQLVGDQHETFEATIPEDRADDD